MIKQTNQNGEDNRNVHHDTKPSPYARYIQIILENKTGKVSKDNVRVDDFMKKHTGMSYAEFIDRAKPG